MFNKQKLINTYLNIMNWWRMLPFERKYLIFVVTLFVVTWMTFIMTIYFREQ